MGICGRVGLWEGVIPCEDRESMPFGFCGVLAVKGKKTNKDWPPREAALSYRLGVWAGTHG